jgi:hypothetical protein
MRTEKLHKKSWRNKYCIQDILGHTEFQDKSKDSGRMLLFKKQSMKDRKYDQEAN